MEKSKLLSENDHKKQSKSNGMDMILNSIQDNIMALDIEGNILYINHDISGITREEMIGKSVYNYIPEKYEKLAKNCYDQVLKSGRPDKYSINFTDSDGIVHYYEMHVGPILKSGNIIGFTVNSTDFTEHKKVEDELRKRIEHLTEIISEVPGLIFQYEVNTNGEERFNFISNGIRELMEIEPELILGNINEVKDLNLEEFFPDLVKQSQELRENLVPWLAQYQFRTKKTGTLKWVEGLAIPTRLTNEKMVWNGWVQEITDRKQMEEELKQTLDDLRRLNADLRLKEEQQRRELEKLIELKTDSGVSQVTKVYGGIKKLKERDYERFSEIVHKFKEYMDLRIDELTFKQDHNISKKLRLIAEKLSILKAGPRDVIEIYYTSLREKNLEMEQGRLEIYTAEGRLMLIELMGYLVSYYRTYSFNVNIRVSNSYNNKDYENNIKIKEV